MSGVSVERSRIAGRASRWIVTFSPLVLMLTPACDKETPPSAAVDGMSPTPRPTTPTPTPAPTPHPVCAEALASSPGDLWPGPQAARVPAAAFVIADGNFTYVRGYAIDSETGGLRYASKLRCCSEGSAQLAAAPSGGFVFCAQGAWGSSFIQSLRVNAAGEVTEVPGGRIAGGPSDVLAHPTRRLVYQGSAIFRAGEDGSLTRLPGNGAAPDVIHPNGVFAYDDERQYCIPDDGVPREVSTYSKGRQGRRAVPMIAGAGRWLVQASEAGLQVHRIDLETGVPTPASWHRSPSYFDPKVVAHPTLSVFYLLGASGHQRYLETYEIDMDAGRLALLDSQRVSESQHASGMEIDPGGRFLHIWKTVNMWEYLTVEVWRIGPDGRPDASGPVHHSAYPLDLLFLRVPPLQP